MGLLRRERKSDVDVESCLANLDRLAVLDQSRIMDSPPSTALDDLTRAAAERLGTPMAFVSMLDHRRAFLAGAFGISGEPAESRQNKAEATYCQYVVALDDVLVVENAVDDALVRDHPATIEGNVRSYLGEPVRVSGRCLGSFCAVDTKPRQWTDEDLATLRTLAARATRHIDLQGRAPTGG